VWCLVLDNNSVSREHAVIAVGGDGAEVAGVYVVDLGSAQGTRLNGTYLEAHQRVRLQPGDRLKFGVSSTEYIVRLGNADAVADVPWRHRCPAMYETLATLKCLRLQDHSQVLVVRKGVPAEQNSKRQTRGTKVKQLLLWSVIVTK
jgi:pSer/pThr/pTyr-binding forkhead associated (FHA) protein